MAVDRKTQIGQDVLPPLGFDPQLFGMHAVDALADIIHRCGRFRYNEIQLAAEGSDRGLQIAAAVGGQVVVSVDRDDQVGEGCGKGQFGLAVCGGW